MIINNQSTSITHCVAKNTLWEGFVLPLLLLCSAFAIATAAYIFLGTLADTDRSLTVTERSTPTERSNDEFTTPLAVADRKANKPATLVLIKSANLKAKLEE